MHGHPPSPRVVQHQGTTRSIAMEGEQWSVIFYSAGVVLHCTALGRQQLVFMGFRVPNDCSNPSS